MKLEFDEYTQLLVDPEQKCCCHQCSGDSPSCPYHYPKFRVDELNRIYYGRKDACEVCHGESGCVPGNDNIVNGVVMCDYCHARQLTGNKEGENV